MINFYKILIVSFLIFNPNLFSQKNIQDYFKQVFPNGVSFDYSITDTILDLKYNYLEFKNKDGNSITILFQAKIINVKKGIDILMFVQEMGDMQCNYQKQLMFEIDKKKDSLISIPFLSKFKIKGYENFIEKDSVEKIFLKYTDSLKSYLQTENNFKQFLEELYDYRFELDKGDDIVYVSLRFCDYIPRNIVGFTEDELEYLEISSYPFFEYKNNARKFKENKKKILVKF